MDIEKLCLDFIDSLPVCEPNEMYHLLRERLPEFVEKVADKRLQDYLDELDPPIDW